MRRGLLHAATQDSTGPHLSCMRIRLSTLALSIAAATTSIAAAYWRDRSTWYSQDEIDAWMTRAKIELADMDEELAPNGEAKMLVARHEAPEDPARPFYWHVCVAGPSDAGPFRPVLESHGWAATRNVAFDAVNAHADDLLIDMLCNTYNPYDGMDLDDLDLDGDGDGGDPVA